MIGQADHKEHWQLINEGAVQVSNTPQQLWEQAINYFKWNDEHPIIAKRTLTSGKTQGMEIPISFKRPYSIKAMCLHCNISERYIKDIMNTNSSDNEWFIIMEKILMIIYTQNLEGAIVDLYNPIMISKVLNMDKEQGETDRAVKVEIVDSRSDRLYNSEREVLEKLDFQKVEVLKDKLDNS